MSRKFAMNVTQSDMKADEVILCCGDKEKHLYARPQGEWVAEYWEDAYQESYHTCSICKKDMRTTHYDNFCPNCGAKMRKVEVENDT